MFSANIQLEFYGRLLSLGKIGLKEVYSAAPCDCFDSWQIAAVAWILYRKQ